MPSVEWTGVWEGGAQGLNPYCDPDVSERTCRPLPRMKTDDFGPQNRGSETLLAFKNGRFWVSDLCDGYPPSKLLVGG